MTEEHSAPGKLQALGSITVSGEMLSAGKLPMQLFLPKENEGSLWGQREEEQSSRMKQKRSPRGPLCSLTKFLNKENFLAPKNQIASER